MNIKLLSIAVLTAALSMSCGSSNHEEPAAEAHVAHEVQEVVAQSYAINTEKSSVSWKGEVAGVYGHEGVVNVKSGNVAVTEGKITGGEITIDMSTIAATDSASYQDEKGHTIKDLEGHLTTGDFFNTAEFPTATFVVTAVSDSKITGDFTVRGKTNSEEFIIESSDVSDSNVTVNGTLKFDRQKYDVAWKHYMKDMVLSNDISLVISVTATK